MIRTAIPAKFPLPWAGGAGAQKNAIATPSLQGSLPGRASLTDGFPPLNFLNINAGGIPPYGADHNGILNQITAWDQWQQAGGAVVYDASFATSIGGYPSGALLASSTVGITWLSLIDNNLVNPDAGPSTSWQGRLSTYSAGGPNYFNSVFAAAIGGYPIGALILSARDPGVYYINATAGNTANPDTTSPSGWFVYKQTSSGGFDRFDAFLANAAAGYPIGAVLQSQTYGTFFVNTIAGNQGNPDVAGTGWAAFRPNYGQTATYSGPATTVWIAPPYVTGVHAIVVGGGGGGADCNASGGSYTSGGGGGAGGYAEGYYAVTPGTSYSVVVGGGGAAQGVGGTSAFGGFLLATGGVGAAFQTVTVSAGGTGGSGASGNILNLIGGYGSDGQAGSLIFAGNGAPGPWGGGGRAGNLGGITGVAPGAGGGGAYDSAQTAVARLGGLGAPGFIMLRY